MPNLVDRLSQRIGDYLDATLTTALTTSKVAVSTNLLDETNRDDYFNRYWLYVENYANDGELRKISDYTASTGTCTVLGANFADDGANLATIQIHKYNRANKIRAINSAARKTFPALHRTIRNTDLIGNNMIPNGRFTDWSVTTVPDYWRVVNATSAATTTAGLTRGGSKSALVTATVDNGYLTVSSAVYPPLLDLMGHTVNFKAWAYPSAANGATIVIYTLKADGTSQTLTSTTTCPATKWSLLSLENQSINDDIQYIRFGCNIVTSGQTCYFANARVIGPSMTQYVLPLDFQNAQAFIDNVYYQTKGTQDDWCDDMSGISQFSPLWGCDIKDDADTRYLVTPSVASEVAIQLEGIAPLESNLVYDTDSMTIKDPYIDLLIEYAAYLLFDMEASIPSSQDRDNLLRESLRYLVSYNDLKRTLKMPLKSGQVRFRKDIL